MHANTIRHQTRSSRAATQTRTGTRVHALTLMPAYFGDRLGRTRCTYGYPHACIRMARHGLQAPP
eukprot:scaffold166628_cov17-Prasinocladus_malaysianus.AAC.1